MKTALKPSKKKTSLNKKFIVGIVALLVLAAIGFVANQYLTSKRVEAQEQARRVAEAVAAHQNAEDSLRQAEASVAALKAEGIEATSVEELLNKLRRSFESKNYSEVGELYDQVVTSSAQLKDEDEVKISSYSAALINLQIKAADYKKQGVNVATVSGEIASASGELEAKKYDTLPPLFGALSKKLDILLALKKEEDKKAALAKAVTVAAPIAAQSSGGVTYERKVVNTSIGGFTSDILTVDLNRVKVKTFAANENDCAADCPVKPLASYVSENGGIAGINGTYFCPPDYSQCAGIKNSFNTLVFDYKSKHYLNSSQNQYSVNPLISFYGDGAHYYTQALGFGRDTSAYGVISNHPTLMHNGGLAVNANLDAKSSSKGIRCGLGFRDKTLWAVCVRGATVNESAYVYQSLGAMYAMNLDGGGSAALYFNGYKVGPGRLLPNAVVFTN